MKLIDTKRLQAWLEARGEGALGDLEKLSGLSIHTLYKMATGAYSSSPSRVTRRALCDATGISEDKLFPSTKGKAS
jgi:transcriptional regulator with XRE-family HTH domain